MLNIGVSTQQSSIDISTTAMQVSHSKSYTGWAKKRTVFLKVCNSRMC